MSTRPTGLSEREVPGQALSAPRSRVRGPAPSPLPDPAIGSGRPSRAGLCGRGADPPPSPGLSGAGLKPGAVAAPSAETHSTPPPRADHRKRMRVPGSTRRDGASYTARPTGRGRGSGGDFPPLCRRRGQPADPGRANQGAAHVAAPLGRYRHGVLDSTQRHLPHRPRPHIAKATGNDTTDVFLTDTGGSHHKGVAARWGHEVRPAVGEDRPPGTQSGSSGPSLAVTAENVHLHAGPVSAVNLPPAGCGLGRVTRRPAEQRGGRHSSRRRVGDPRPPRSWLCSGS